MSLSTADNVAAKNRKDVKFVRLLDREINASDMTQRDISLALGYDKPNIITMFKQGTTRIPVDKVPLLAKALGLDVADLTRLWMEEYEPKLLEVIQAHIGMALSKNERSWVANLRKTFKDGVPAWDELTEKAIEPLVKD